MNDMKKTLENKWLNKTIRLKEDSDYQLPKTNYLVTAVLFDHFEEEGKETS